jgi:hypothetical protein
MVRGSELSPPLPSPEYPVCSTAIRVCVRRDLISAVSFSCFPQPLRLEIKVRPLDPMLDLGPVAPLFVLFVRTARVS